MAAILLESHEWDIYEIEQLLENSTVIEKINLKKIGIGTKIELQMDGVTKHYQLCDPVEVDINKNKISPESPIGSALLGMKSGQKKEITIAGKALIIEIIALTA